MSLASIESLTDALVAGCHQPAHSFGGRLDLISDPIPSYR
jgi:hypothetical protein